MHKITVTLKSSTELFFIINFNSSDVLNKHYYCYVRNEAKPSYIYACVKSFNILLTNCLNLTHFTNHF